MSSAQTAGPQNLYLTTEWMVSSLVDEYAPESSTRDERAFKNKESILSEGSSGTDVKPGLSQSLPAGPFAAAPSVTATGQWRGHLFHVTHESLPRQDTAEKQKPESNPSALCFLDCVETSCLALLPPCCTLTRGLMVSDQI